MAIAPGSKLPHAKFKIMTASGPSEISAEELFKGKKAVLFAVPEPSPQPATPSIYRGFYSTPKNSRRKAWTLSRARR